MNEALFAFALVLLAGAALIFFAVRHLVRAPSPSEKEQLLLLKTKDDLINAERSLEDWKAEVAKLRARIARLDAKPKPARTTVKVGWRQPFDQDRAITAPGALRAIGSDAGRESKL